MIESTDVERILAQAGRDLTFHSIVAACCSQIPLPLVDGMARRVVRGSMFANVGRSYHHSLSAGDILTLSGDPPEEDKGCLRGCLSLVFFKVLLFPVRKIVQTINFVRNYQDLMDQAAQNFVEGYLLAYLLDSKQWPSSARQARTAIDAVMAESDIRPVKAVFSSILSETRAEVQHASGLIFKKLRFTRAPDKKKVTQALDQVLPLEEELLAPILVRILAAMNDPHDYLESLHEKLVRQLPAGV